MKQIATTIAVLLALVMALGCKKTSHEIFVNGKPFEPDTAIITLTHLETVKDSDRDGVFYKDVFAVRNVNEAPFISAETQANMDIGLLADVIHEPNFSGERIVVLRRKSNVSYKIRSFWKVSGRDTPYLNVFNFTREGE